MQALLSSSLTSVFLVADTQLYKRLSLSVRPSVGNDQVKKWENKRFGYSRCRLDLEIRGNSLQKDKYTQEADNLEEIKNGGLSKPFF